MAQFLLEVWVLLQGPNPQVQQFPKPDPVFQLWFCCRVFRSGLCCPLADRSVQRSTQTQVLQVLCCREELAVLVQSLAQRQEVGLVVQIVDDVIVQEGVLGDVQVLGSGWELGLPLQGGERRGPPVLVQVLVVRVQNPRQLAAVLGFTHSLVLVLWRTENRRIWWNWRSSAVQLKVSAELNAGLWSHMWSFRSSEVAPLQSFFINFFRKENSHYICLFRSRGSIMRPTGWTTRVNSRFCIKPAAFHSFWIKTSPI